MALCIVTAKVVRMERDGQTKPPSAQEVHKKVDDFRSSAVMSGCADSDSDKTINRGSVVLRGDSDSVCLHCGNREGRN